MTHFTAEKPCPVCNGHPRLPQGHGQRCWGFLSEDGCFAHCTREEFAQSIAVNSKSQTYPHRLGGLCNCGQTHGGGAPVHDIGEARSARIVATYDYTDEHGKLLYQVVRKEPKTFRQRRPDGAGGWLWNLDGVEPVPYRFPALLAAVAAGDTVYIAEGEKDVDALGTAGYVATCNSGGAGKWQPRFRRHFEGAHVVLIRDKDEPGLDHARDVFGSLRSAVESFRVVEAREGKDAADHLAAGHTVEQLIPVWPLDDLRESEPVAWKRALIYRSRDTGDPFRHLNVTESLARPDDPRWPTGLEGEPGTLPNFRGVTILVGGPSSGKSYLAVASACQAAWAGWDVLYLSSEMGDRVIAQRLCAYSGEQEPCRLIVQQVDFGADVSALIDLVAEHVGERNLLVVFDSISSFVDQAQMTNDKDVHQIGPLKQLIMWAINLRRNTQGQISFLVLSETNAEGRTKGRFGDHKADLVVKLETDKDHPTAKHIIVMKGWEYQIGKVGMYGLNVKTARLTRLE